MIPRPFFETRYNGRLDYVFNPKNTAYISYTSQVNDSLNDQSDGTGDLTNGNFTKNHLIVANLTLSSILSNVSVNQFTFGYQFWNNLIDSNISAPLVVFPSASFGTNTNVPQESIQKKWQFRDDFSKTLGRHTLKTGVDFINNPWKAASSSSARRWKSTSLPIPARFLLTQPPIPTSSQVPVLLLR